LLVQSPHRLVSLLALGQQPFEPGALRGGDLGALQCGCDAAPAPVAPSRREAVMRFVAEDLKCGIADDLVARERDEAELGPASGPVDLVRAPLLERLHAFRARDVLVRLDADGVHLAEQVRLLDARDDPDGRRWIDGRLADRRKIESDGLLPADANEATVLEE